MGFDTRIEGNPLNPTENRILSKEPPPEDEEDHDRLHSYTLKVGDVCFVAIGQIVGRRYDAVEYIPTAMVSLRSPVEIKALRERMSALWASKDPAKKLLDSLLLDFSTEGKSANGWHDAGEFQVKAAMRLLYYFPKESAPLVAERLRSNVKVSMVDLIKAVSWNTAPEIQDALAYIAQRTHDPEVKEALKGRRKKNP